MRSIHYFLAFLLLTIFSVTITAPLHNVALAQDAVINESVTSDTIENADQTPTSSEPSFLDDLKQARDILTKDTTNRPFLRGLMMPLFQPVFMLIMFCCGLWTGQQSGKLSTIWAVPIVLFVSVVAAAFITEFHPEWKPDLTFADKEYIPDMTANGVTGVLLAVMIGGVVAAQMTFPAYIALIFAAGAGLGLGFTHTIQETVSDDHLISFWLGFGLSGLIFNIIGIGFETFLESINLSVIVRLVGFVCVCLGFVLAVNVF